MKRLCLTGLCVVCMSVHMYGQPIPFGTTVPPNGPVLDIMKILSAIESGYTMYQQLQAAYNMIKSNYDKLKQQMKNFESFDFKNMDAMDPLGSWRSLMTYADRMATYEENMERIIKRKDIKIGNGSYSLGDLFMSNPVTTAEGLGTDAFTYVAVDPFEKNLTSRERAIYNQRFGMSYAHSMRFAKLGEALQKKAAQTNAYSNEWQKGLGEDRERLQKLMNDGFGNDGQMQQQQLANAQMQGMAQDLKTSAKVLEDFSSMYAMEASQSQEVRKADQERRNTSYIDMPDSFIEMMKIDHSQLE